MARDNLHLTLAFLGDLSAERVADARAAADGLAAGSFELRLDRLGYWKHNRILWAGGESAPLTALATALAERLRARSFRLDERPFAAHVTLLRDARCPALPALAEALAWPVAEFVLARSPEPGKVGAYEIVGRWPLGE